MKENETFYSLGIAPDMLKVLDKMKFVKPTSIQAKAIPLGLKGDDIVGIAQTGTGKTLAFGIPTIQRLAAHGGRALVIVPTRELAIQVDQVLRNILYAFRMKSAVLIGGVKIGPQITDIKKNPHILIGTPGRLLDLLYQGVLDLGDMKILVIDEADRMYDMGFAPQVDKVLRCLPPERQTMLFSATMPPDIIKLATKHMKLPIHIEIAPSGTVTEEVSQELFIVQEPVKKKLLGMLLNKYRGTVLVFTRTKMKAGRTAKMIREMGHNAAEIHSDRTMSQRQQAIDGFKSGRYRILVATDIAARGIDVSMIELVVNYDLPEEIENYVHRIGRTGRAGATGHAVSFATPQQSFYVTKIEEMIRMALPRGKHPEFHSESFSGVQEQGRHHKSSGGRKKDFDFKKTRGQSGRRGENKKFGGWHQLKNNSSRNNNKS